MSVFCRPARVQRLLAQQHGVEHMKQETTAVVIVDHGSRKESSNRMLQEFVDLYRCDRDGIAYYAEVPYAWLDPLCLAQCSCLVVVVRARAGKLLKELIWK